jgi:hypothetical protein
MVTRAKKPAAAKVQGRVDLGPKPAPLTGILPARAAAGRNLEPAIHPGDWIALVGLIFGLLFMGLINLYDLVSALFRR